MTGIAAPRPFFEVSGLRLRIWPILLAFVLMQALLWPEREGARWLFAHWHGPFHGQAWAFIALATSFQMIAGLVAAAALRRLLPQADTHLRWPPGRSYALAALFIGVAMAVVMFVPDHWPELARGVRPADPYHATPATAPAYILVMLAAGPNEELIFRGVLVGMLAVLTPGRVRVGAFEVPVAGGIVALLFGAAHYASFLAQPLPQAIAQQVYAFAWGLIYVWLMERSRSLLAPAIAHGAGDAVEVGVVMLLALAG